jgi:hypothetical protein
MKVGAKIIQRITRNTASDVVHSSGLAGMGMSGQRRGTMSFEERQAIAQNRKIVQGYKNSRIARDIGGMPSTRSYGREAGVTERQGYGRTAGEPDKRCRYGRTSAEEMEERYGYGRKSSDDVKKERMEQHSDKRGGLRGSGGGMMAIGGSGSISSGNAPQQNVSRMKKYYDFRPDLGFENKSNDPTANF